MARRRNRLLSADTLRRHGRAASHLVTLALLFGAGCGSAGGGGAVVAPTTRPVLVVATDSPVQTSAKCTDSTAPGTEERRRGVEALLAGKAREASTIFEEVLARNPGDLGAETLRIASLADLANANAHASRSLDDEAFVTLPELPLAYRLNRPLPVTASEPLRVEKVSLAKNLITEDDAWLKKNGLTPLSRRPRGDDLPEFVAANVRGTPIHDLFHFDDHDIGVYGDAVVAFADGKKPRAFDVSRITKTHGGGRLEVDFAEVVGDVLLLQLARNGYAKDVAGKTGFIAAVGAREGDLRWCSEPLVANAQNFVTVGQHLITGYGFTAEPDSLFVLDLATGKVETKEPLQSGPSFLLRKEDKLFVRTYDTDMVFRLTPALASAPRATVFEDDAGAPGRPTVDPETRCFVDAALARIDARDPSGLAPVIGSLRARGASDTLVKAFSGAESFLVARADRPGIDLGTRPIAVIEAPPWEYAFRGVSPTGPSGASPSKARRAPRLVKRAGSKADPVRNMRAPTGADPSVPIFIAPVSKGKLPPGARADIPSRFGVEDLRAVIPSGDRLILVYGGRYVAIVNGSTTEHVLDFEAFRHPPKANPQWAEFAVEDVTYAHVEGTVLYVANGGGSYAREVFGKKGFMSAIDLTTHKLIWRSDPLVVDSTFAVVGDFIATGYGFTDEADWLLLLRRDTGAIATKSHLDTAPESVTAAGNRIHVEAYANAYDFDLVP